MAVKPISPDEIGAAKRQHIPDVVFQVVNELLARNYTNGSATIKQNEIVEALEEKGFTRNEIFSKNLLNFEESYRDEGWSVVYDKPAYYESYDAYFKFKKRMS